MKFKVLITIISSCLASGFFWGILSSQLFPGNRTIFWIGTFVLAVLVALIMLWFLSTRLTQQRSGLTDGKR